MNNYKIKIFHSVIKDNTAVMANVIECSFEEDTQNYLTFDFIIGKNTVKEYLCNELKTIYDLDLADELDKDLLGVYFVGDKGLVINTAELLSICYKNNICARISPNYIDRVSIEFEKVSVLKEELK